MTKYYDNTCKCEYCRLIEASKIIRHEDEINKSIKKHLKILPTRLKKIIILRFGLFGYDAHTLTAIAEILGVSRERIRQLEGKALNILRKAES